MSEGVPVERLPPAGGDTEEIDALPVPVQAAPVFQRPRQPAGRLAELRAVPAVQAAAVAAGGFVAGAAVAGLARRRRDGRVQTRRGGAIRRRSGEMLEVIGTRSMLVDVHFLSPARSARKGR